MATAGSSSSSNTVTETTPAPSRPKRVRTGCLTCRERHLKCDEGQPHCQNCRKSNRICKRGVRLNFIDTQVVAPPQSAWSQEWQIGFMDESREIASEYRGGLGRYANLEKEELPLSGYTNQENLAFELRDDAAAFSFQDQLLQQSMSNQVLQTQPLPSMQQPPPSMTQSYQPQKPENGMGMQMQDSNHHRQHSMSDGGSSYTDRNGSFSDHAPPMTSYSNPDQTLTPPYERREYLKQPEEVLFMQVFVEEVGLWMDSMDPLKHVSSPRVLPTMRKILTSEVFATLTISCS